MTWFHEPLTIGVYVVVEVGIPLAIFILRAFVHWLRNSA